MIDIIAALQTYRAEIDVHDPWVDPAEAQTEYGLTLQAQPPAGHYAAIILAVAHAQFRELGHAAIRAYGQPGAVLYDVEHLLPREAVDGRL